MLPLRLLGRADTLSCVFILDRAEPRSRASLAFLYKNSLASKLNSFGRLSTHLTIDVPTQGGFYTSKDLVLECSPSCRGDIVLGSDWFTSVSITPSDNVLPEPSLDRVVHLPQGHEWTPDCKCPFDFC